MIKINLLPHREAKRKERINAFYTMLAMTATAGGLVVLLIGGVFANQISNQDARNEFIAKENKRLDEEIKKIATLKEEIDALKARQQAVEDLQSDRNQPVYLLDELAKQVPEGIHLKSVKQTGQRVALNGYAHSNERVSELLRNMSNSSPWLEQPELIEIRSIASGQGRDAKKVFDFTVNVGIKRPKTNDQDAPAIQVNTPASPSSSKSKKS